MTKDEALKMAIEDAMKFVVTLNNYEDAIQSKPFKNEADRYLSYASVVIKSLATSLQEALEQPAQEPVAWEDKEDEWSEAIAASHPLQTKSFVEYESAMKMVGNRKSKGALVDLVCYLLQHFNADANHHQWQGLTDDEIAKLNLDGFADESELEFAHAIEQALRSKNI